MVPSSMNYYHQMMKITIGFWLISAMACIPGLFYGDYLPVILIICYSGLCSLLLLGLIAFNYKKFGILFNVQIHKTFLYDLVNLYDKNPERFEKKYKQLQNSGRVYLLVLILASIASLVGFVITAYVFGSASLAIGIGSISMYFFAHNTVKYLFVKYEQTDITCLERFEHPELFQHVDHACIKVGLGELDKIVINEDSGFSILNVYLGRWRKPEWILVIGLFPYLLLTEEELESIIIHELMHKKLTETEKGYATYQKSAYWSRVFSNAEKGGRVTRAFLKYFSNDFVLKMKLFERALSKIDESRVDRESIRYTDKDIYAQALMKITIISEFFSKELDLMKFEDAPKHIYSLLFDEFRAWFESNRNVLLETIRNQRTFQEDSHLRFKERMVNIGVNDLSLQVEFPDSIDSREKVMMMDRMNQAWLEANESLWKARKKEYLENLQTVDVMEDASEHGNGLEYGLALEKIGKLEEALQFYDEILDNEPDNALVLCRIGAIYHRMNDEKCIEIFQRAVTADRSTIPYCLEGLEDYLVRNGLVERRNDLAEWMEEMAEISLDKEYEETHILPSDQLNHIKLADEEREELIRSLKEIPAVARVLIAEKELRHSKEGQLIGGICFKKGLIRRMSKKARLADWERVFEAFNKVKHTYCLYDLKANSVVESKLVEVENALFYERS